MALRRENPILARRSSLLLRREEGAAAVEFALISLILFTVVFGIIQYGLWLSEYQVMQGAAREGARTAAIRTCSSCSTDATAVQTAVTNSASPYTVPGPNNITPGRQF